MIRKKVLGIGSSSATLLVQDTEADGELRVLRRINVAGWPTTAAQAAHDMYEAVHRTNPAGIVRVHAVLMQNSFLNVVTDYCEGGDLAIYLEEEVKEPLPEKQALLWMLVLAQALQQLHVVAKVPWHGPTLDRVYLDSGHGTAGIIGGAPVCPHMYFKALQDRRSDGVAVEAEYPPEALQGGDYHPQASDVWHLGLLGTKLLSAHSQLGSRSAAARQLVSRMMEPALRKRISLEEAIGSLKSIVGDIKLRKPAERKTGSGNNRSTPNASTAKVSAPPTLSTKTPSGTAPTGPGNGNNSNNNSHTVATQPSSSTASSPPDVSLTAPNRAVNGNRSQARGTPPPPPSQQQEASPREAPSHRDPVVSARRANAGATGATGAPRGQRTGAVPDSWHRKAEEQFAELQRMNASPPVQRHPASRSASPRESGGGNALRRPSPTAVSVPVSPRQGGGGAGHYNSRRSPSVNAAPSSARGSGVLDSNTKALNEMFAEREAQALRQERLREDMEWRRRRQALDERKANRERAQHQTHLRHIYEDDSGGRQADIRRHLREWKERQEEELANGYGENVVVLTNSNVTILAPRPAPPERPPAGYRDTDDASGKGGTSSAVAPAEKRSARPGSARGGASAGKRRISDDDFLPDHNKNVPVTILVPKNPPPASLATANQRPPPPTKAPPPLATAPRSGGGGGAAVPRPPPSPPPQTPSDDQITPSNLSSPGYVTPREAKDLLGAQPRGPAAATAPPPHPPSGGPHRHASPPSGDPYRRFGADDDMPRARVPTPQLRQQLQQQQRWAATGASSPHPQVPPVPQPSAQPSSRRATPPPPPSHVSGSFSDTASGRRGTSVHGHSTADASTMGTLEWTIDGVRSAVRTLLGNRALYGEAMMAVAEFVARGEEARMQPRQNDEFMVHMRGLLTDDRVFGAAAPLCVQLVALEGLYQAVRENGGGPGASRQ